METNRVVVGVADMYISNHEKDHIITFSLGSCLGVTVFDPELRLGGLIHCMLPTARLDMGKAEERPEMFVDTGLTLLLQKFFDFGAVRNRLVVKLAGAASVLNDNMFFRVGERNYICAKKLLEKNHIPVAAEDVLGTMSRTVSLEIATGMTKIRSQNREQNL